MKWQIANGVWMSLAGAAVELFIPQWFGDAPIVLRTDRIVVCKIEEMRKEQLLEGVRPIDIAFLQKTPFHVPLLREAGKPANLLIALAEPVILPPVRWRARLDDRMTGARCGDQSLALRGRSASGRVPWGTTRS